MLSLFINWDISPEIFNLGGISIRYYGLLFAVAFILGYKVEEKMFKSEGLPMAWLDKLWLYVAIATIVGARLGHCIFYDWAYYKDTFGISLCCSGSAVCLFSMQPMSAW